MAGVVLGIGVEGAVVVEGVVVDPVAVAAIVAPLVAVGGLAGAAVGGVEVLGDGGAVGVGPVWVVVMVVHADGGVGLLVVGGRAGGKEGLVRVDVAAAAGLHVVIAGQVAVELVVFDGVNAYECSGSEK